MKTYQGRGELSSCDIHPSSTMHALMEAAERSGKPEDTQKVSTHYDNVQRAFLKECGLSKAQYMTRWSMGAPRGLTRLAA